MAKLSAHTTPRQICKCINLIKNIISQEMGERASRAKCLVTGDKISASEFAANYHEEYAETKELLKEKFPAMRWDMDPREEEQLVYEAWKAPFVVEKLGILIDILRKHFETTDDVEKCMQLDTMITGSRLFRPVLSTQTSSIVVLPNATCAWVRKTPGAIFDTQIWPRSVTIVFFRPTAANDLSSRPMDSQGAASFGYPDPE